MFLQSSVYNVPIIIIYLYVLHVSIVVHFLQIARHYYFTDDYGVSR